jgi:hypothetical protein
MRQNQELIFQTPHFQRMQTVRNRDPHLFVLREFQQDREFAGIRRLNHKRRRILLLDRPAQQRQYLLLRGVNRALWNLLAQLRKTVEKYHDFASPGLVSVLLFVESVLTLGLELSELFPPFFFT